jgi:hypothetical protein
MLICLQEKACVYFESFRAAYKTDDSAGTMAAFSTCSTSFADVQPSAAINTLLNVKCYFGFKNKPVSYTDNAEFTSNNRES